MTNTVVQTSPTPVVSSVKFGNSTASVLLDTIRGVAAFLVCISHWRYLFFVDFPELSRLDRKLWAIPYTLCTLGHASVTVFFVLSGFLVGGQALRAMRADRWSWREYLLQRFARLYTVLLPALLIGGLLDAYAIHRGIEPALYLGQGHNGVIQWNVGANLSWQTLLGNVLFVQTRWTPVWGSNGPLWSLSCEFWFYMLFPCTLFAIMASKRPIRRWIMGLVTLCLLVVLGKNYAWGYAVWLMGAALAAIPIRRSTAWLRWAALVVYFPLFVVSDRAHLFRSIPLRCHWASRRRCCSGLYLERKSVPRIQAG